MEIKTVYAHLLSAKYAAPFRLGEPWPLGPNLSGVASHLPNFGKKWRLFEQAARSVCGAIIRGYQP
jgi:hypothetical protein